MTTPMTNEEQASDTANDGGGETYPHNKTAQCLRRLREDARDLRRKARADLERADKMDEVAQIAEDGDGRLPVVWVDHVMFRRHS